jgi:hypothetical protein
MTRIIYNGPVKHVIRYERLVDGAWLEFIPTLPLFRRAVATLEQELTETAEMLSEHYGEIRYRVETTITE